MHRAWLCTPTVDLDTPRSELFKEGAAELQMPDVEPFGYIIEMLEQLGFCTADGGVSWQELRAWIEVSGTKASYWELTMLRKLSNLFYSSAKRFNNSAEQSPMILENRDPMDLVKDLKAGFRQVAPENKR